MAHGPWREQHPRTQTRPGQARGRQNREGELPKEAERPHLECGSAPAPESAVILKAALHGSEDRGASAPELLAGIIRA
jgi:hypothetical protein